ISEYAKETFEDYVAPSFDGDGKPHPVVESVLQHTLDEVIDEPQDPRITEQQIRAAEDMDDLVQAYQEEGYDIDDPLEAGMKAKTDWWLHTRNRFEEDRDTVHITYKDGDTEYSLDVTLFGFAHGQRNYFVMDDEVKQYLQKEVHDLVEETDKVYTEQNIAHLLDLEDGPIFEMQDHTVLEGTAFEALGDDEEEEETDETTETGEPNPYLKTLETAGDRLTDALAARYDTPMLDHLGSINEGLEDPDALEDVQASAYANDLPRELQIAYDAARYEGMREGLTGWIEDQWNEDDALLGEVKNAALFALHWEGGRVLDNMEELFGKIGHGRSEYMAGFVLDDLLDPETDETALVIGAGHQPHIIDYLQELDEDTISAFQEDRLDGAWLEDFPRADLETERLLE
ncbi:MAG: hypothetical protein MUP66_03475, partial [Candidatus Nanohaloarchaeota archaeon QJJ-5]|nr:hypothetical protein [Candidatus Nanohaloarchaeota archaeon QJJ-5]